LHKSKQMKIAKLGKRFILASALTAAIGTTTVVVTTTQPQQTTIEAAAIVPMYAGNTWELQNSLNNGLFDYIKPTGDIRSDFGRFLFGQGGGKSKDPKDQITAFPNAWPPCVDKDGYKYHTVHDITWYLFSNRDFMNTLVIFQTAIVDKMYDNMDFDKMETEDRYKMAMSCGRALHDLIHTYTGLDTYKVEDFV